MYESTSSRAVRAHFKYKYAGEISSTFSLSGCKKCTKYKNKTCLITFIDSIYMQMRHRDRGSGTLETDFVTRNQSSTICTYLFALSCRFRDNYVYFMISFENHVLCLAFHFNFGFQYSVMFDMHVYTHTHTHTGLHTYSSTRSWAQIDAQLAHENQLACTTGWNACPIHLT